MVIISIFADIGNIFFILDLYNCTGKNLKLTRINRINFFTPVIRENISFRDASKIVINFLLMHKEIRESITIKFLYNIKNIYIKVIKVDIFNNYFNYSIIWNIVLGR